MEIIYIGHSCFKIDAAEGSVVFDPYEKKYVPGLKAVDAKADLVLCSHGHGDHNAVFEVEQSGRKPSIKVTEFETFHDDKQGSLRGMNTVRIVEMENKRVAHMGDIGCDLTADQLAVLKGVDVLLIPIGGYYTIDDRQAAEMTAKIMPKIAIPMHYRGKGFGFDVIGTADRFEALVKELTGDAVAVKILTPMRSSANGESTLTV